MQEVARALLLPPPGWISGRAAARHQIDEDAAGARPRVPTPFDAFNDGGAQDEVRLRARTFRFKVYGDRGELNEDRSAFKAPVAESPEQEETPRTGGSAVDILDGFGEGDAHRNSAAFVASLIAQSRLSQGLHNPAFGAANNAYRRAGGEPPLELSRAQALNIAI